MLLSTAREKGEAAVAQCAGGSGHENYPALPGEPGNRPGNETKKVSRCTCGEGLGMAWHGRRLMLGRVASFPGSHAPERKH